MRRWTKLGVPARILVGMHVAYAIAFALLAVVILLPSSDPGLDEWPVNPTLAILPLSLIIALGALVILFGITEWVGRGRKGILFALDWAVPVFVIMARGDSLRDPGLLLENAPSLGILALATACGVLLLVVRPPLGIAPRADASA
jgi:hypothetical protein